MKKSELKQIIKEEYAKILSEKSENTLPQVNTATNPDNIRVSDLVKTESSTLKESTLSSELDNLYGNVGLPLAKINKFIITNRQVIGNKPVDLFKIAKEKLEESLNDIFDILKKVNT